MRLLPLLLLVGCAPAPIDAELAGERALLADGPLFDAERLPRIRVPGVAGSDARRAGQDGGGADGPGRAGPNGGADGPWRVRLNGADVPIEVQRRGEDVLLIVRAAEVEPGPATLSLHGAGERTWSIRWGAP